MIAYWLMYLLPAIPALILARRFDRMDLVFAFSLWLLFTLLIGFRYQVGGDWFNYLGHYERDIGKTFQEAVFGGWDPGYALLNWISARLGWGIEFVNLVSGAIFTAGLLAFCRQQPSPWLAFAIAVPYIVIVIGMGYTRQGVALGLIFGALTYLEREKLWQFLLLVGIAALFHKSAVLVVPLGLVIAGQNRYFQAIVVIAVGLGLWDLLLESHQERLWDSYVEAQMQSHGALIRVVMNLVPALLLLFYWRRWEPRFPGGGFWLWLALASILSVFLVNFASTAVDRVAFYLMPLQLAVFSRLPFMLKREVSPELITLLILLGYAAVLFVWFNYAIHARYWIPYQNSLFLN
jgi:hypothetical protein